jgi:hypothetical protein
VTLGFFIDLLSSLWSEFPAWRIGWPILAITLTAAGIGVAQNHHDADYTRQSNGFHQDFLSALIDASRSQFSQTKLFFRPRQPNSVILKISPTFAGQLKRDGGNPPLTLCYTR